MAVARVLSSCAAVLAIAGCAALAIAMSQADTAPGARPDPLPTLSVGSDPPAKTWTPHRAAPIRSVPAIRRAAHPAHARPPAAAPAPTQTHSTRPVAAHPVATSPAASSTAPRPPATPAPRPKPVATVAPRRGSPLPVAGRAPAPLRVITVAASSYRSTTATLQAWVAAPGGGWLKHGSAILAHVGADGLSTAPSESRSATPVGSFTLTQAFGAYADPGTALPYFRTNSADWWISQSGPLYNTHQHCGSGCGFTRGDPNEHLAYELPYYRYAVVIDYNTRNAPGGVRRGAGSAFFLHVTDGRATAGCVAIPQSNLVSIMRWLTPSAHPRILIGVA